MVSFLYVDFIAVKSMFHMIMELFYSIFAGSIEIIDLTDRIGG